MGERTGRPGERSDQNPQCSELYEQGVVLELCATLRTIPSCKPVRRGGSVGGINATRVVVA